MRVVIDLSALRALPAARVSALCATHEVWAIEGLIYELMTTEDHTGRAGAFRKIQQNLNSIQLIADSGYLWGKELQLNRPVDPVVDSEMGAVTWLSDPRLQDPLFRPLTAIPDVIEWRNEMQRRVTNFGARTRGVAESFFPELVGLRAGDRARIEPVLRDLCGDSDLLIRLYWRLAQAVGEVVPEGFGQEWMGYRLLQAQLVWALDHISRYGEGVGAVDAPRLENVYCDVEYAAVAAHADALLTFDALQARLFRMIAPNVLCVPDLAN